LAKGNTVAIQIEGLEQVIQALKELRALCNSMHLPTILVFMQVAMQPGIQKPYIQRKLGLSTSACSRHIAILTHEGYTRKKRAGFGLVWTDFDPDDSRQKRVWLTPKGASLVESAQRSLLNLGIMQVYKESPFQPETGQEHLQAKLNAMSFNADPFPTHCHSGFWATPSSTPLDIRSREFSENYKLPISETKG
jgi:DNA-binding MarR family transcriptional regulator